VIWQKKLLVVATTTHRKNPLSQSRMHTRTPMKANKVSADTGIRNVRQRQAVAAEPQPDLPEDAQRLRLHIAQMDCPTEEALIRRSLSGLPDVLRLDFDLLNRILTVHHRQQNIADIHSKLKAVGMSGTPLDVGQSHAVLTEKPSRRQYWKMALGGIAAFSAEVIAWISGKENSVMIGVLALFAILICGILP
jgi:Cd2+/Zn2+-exporting ATPase